MPPNAFHYCRPQSHTIFGGRLRVFDLRLGQVEQRLVLVHHVALQHEAVDVFHLHECQQLIVAICERESGIVLCGVWAAKQTRQLGRIAWA